MTLSVPPVCCDEPVATHWYLTIGHTFIIPKSAHTMVSAFPRRVRLGNLGDTSDFAVATWVAVNQVAHNDERADFAELVDWLEELS